MRTAIWLLCSMVSVTFLSGVARGQQFPPGTSGPQGCPFCPDCFPTTATFKLRFMDGSVMQLGGFSDPSTQVGRSDRYEAPFIQFGLPQLICGGGTAQFPNTAASFPPTCRTPAEWHIFDSPFFDTVTGLFPNPFNSPYRARVATEILSMNLQGLGGSAIRAGQPFYSSLASNPNPLLLQRFYRNSTGEVASRFTPDWPICQDPQCCQPSPAPCPQHCGHPCYSPGQDFNCTDPNYRCVTFSPDCNAPFGGCYAASFFNVYVEVDIPLINKKAYNKTPLVVKTSINSFPPNLALPNSAYLHDPDFGGVPLFDQNGLPFAWLLSAGHGGTGGGFPTVDPPLPLPGTAAFSIDDQSPGLNPLITLRNPNHVFADQAQARRTLTVYSSSGATPGSVADMTNARDPVLQATAFGGPADFQVGDAINGFSYGRDGAVGEFVIVPSNPEFPIPPVGPYATLFFSVSRTSTGEHCTDVNLNSAVPPPAPAEQAADIYVGRCKPFGRYDDGGAIMVPLGTKHMLAGDSTYLGLRPLLTDALQDNVTGLELTIFDPTVDYFFGTFTGPSFAGPGDQATIFRYHAPGAFNRGNLLVYAMPFMMGLVDGDVIDALAVSDTTVGASPCAQQPDGIANPGDEVLFSLAPGSPTLSLGYSAADVFHSGFNGTFSVFRNSFDLGLLASDDIDAIDIRGFNGMPGGACCFGLLGCRFLTRPDCMQQGGFFLGDDSSCLGDSNGDHIDDACQCFCPGDMNRSGIVTAADIPGFVQALLGCGDICADTNGDGVIDGRDVQRFVQLVLAGHVCP